MLWEKLLGNTLQVVFITNLIKSNPILRISVTKFSVIFLKEKKLWRGV